MVVIIVENIAPSVRGYISQWLIEPKTGVFVGDISTRVRTKLWADIQKEMGEKSNVIMIYNANNEQGFAIEQYGNSRRTIKDFDGIMLVKFK